MDGRTVMAAGAALVMGVSACNKGLKEKTLHFNEKDTNNFGFADNPPKENRPISSSHGFAGGR